MRAWKQLRHLVRFSLVGFLSACGAEPTCHETRTCPPRAETGGTIGDPNVERGGAAQTVGLNGGRDNDGAGGDSGGGGAKGTNDAGSGGEAQSDAPVDQGNCDKARDGEQACSGHAGGAILICEAGIWRILTECPPGTLCDSRDQECRPIAAGCENRRPGEAFCEQGTLRACGRDLVDVEDQVCSGSCFAGECVPPKCGDGTKQVDEECDDGNQVESDDCLTTCVAAKCGDGVVHESNERCDDGNSVDLDGCSAKCQVEIPVQVSEKTYAPGLHRDPILLPVPDAYVLVSDEAAMLLDARRTNAQGKTAIAIPEGASLTILRLKYRLRNGEVVFAPEARTFLTASGASTIHAVLYGPGVSYADRPPAMSVRFAATVGAVDDGSRVVVQVPCNDWVILQSAEGYVADHDIIPCPGDENFDVFAYVEGSPDRLPMRYGSAFDIPFVQGGSTEVHVEVTKSEMKYQTLSATIPTGSERLNYGVRIFRPNWDSAIDLFMDVVPPQVAEVIDLPIPSGAFGSVTYLATGILRISSTQEARFEWEGSSIQSLITWNATTDVALCESVSELDVFDLATLDFHGRCRSKVP
jgi:cysteine-rich repeat protein